MNYQPDKNKPFMEISKNEELKIIPDKEHNAHQRQLRIDTFACAAMNAMLDKDQELGVPPEETAEEAYNMAEAMEAERARRMKG